MKKHYLSLAFAALATIASSSISNAADETASEQAQSAIDIAFGAAITSNYVSRGLTLSDDKPAFQAYMEASYGIVYAGVWGSTYDVLDDNKAEIDLSVGIRPEFGKVSLDIGYARYYYSFDGDCCGEVYAKADFAATEAISVGAEIFHDFDADATYLRAKGSYALPYDFSLSGGFGGYAQFKQLDWDLGVSKTFKDTFKVDVRYYGYNDDVDTTHKFVAALSFDTSLSALSGN